MVGAVRFELTTSCTRNKRASRATLRPEPRSKTLPGKSANGNDNLNMFDSARVDGDALALLVSFCALKGFTICDLRFTIRRWTWQPTSTPSGGESKRLVRAPAATRTR